MSGPRTASVSLEWVLFPVAVLVLLLALLGVGLWRPPWLAGTDPSRPATPDAGSER